MAIPRNLANFASGIDSSNNVAIGNQSPQARLDVQAVGTSAAATTLNLFNPNSSGSSAGNDLNFQMWNNASARTTYATLKSIVEANTAGAENGSLRFLTIGSGSLSERMRITNLGIVSINNNAPSTSGVNSGLLNIFRAGYSSSNDISYGIVVRTSTGTGGSAGAECGGIYVAPAFPNYTTVYGLKVDMTAGGGGTGQPNYGGWFKTASGNSNENTYALYAENACSTSDGLYATVYALYGSATGTGANSVSVAGYMNAADRANTRCMNWNDAYSTNATKTMVYITRNASAVGTITTSLTGTTYNTTSDYRLKGNVQVLQNALGDVMRMRPVTYDWIGKNSTGIGFIAHELQEIVPQAVTGQKDETRKTTKTDSDGKMIVNPDGSPKLFDEPVYQGVDTSMLVAHLVKAIQELKLEFDAYKASHP